MNSLSLLQGEILFVGDIDIPEEKKNPQATGDGNRVYIDTSDSLDEKFKLFDISAELRASFMAGLFSVSGSGKCLNESKKTSKSSSITLVYSVSTITETLYLTQLKDFIDFDVLLNTKASHILTSINYGANCTGEVKSWFQYR